MDADQKHAVSSSDALQRKLRVEVMPASPATDGVGRKTQRKKLNAQAISLAEEARAVEDKGDTRGALALYDRALALVPKHEKAWEWQFARGRLLSAQNDHLKAMAAFSMAIELRPSELLLRCVRAQTAIDVRDFKFAESELLYVLRRESEHECALELQKRLSLMSERAAAAQPSSLLPAPALDSALSSKQQPKLASLPAAAAPSTKSVASASAAPTVSATPKHLKTLDSSASPTASSNAAAATKKSLPSPSVASTAPFQSTGTYQLLLSQCLWV
jgi:tetratricopeptide (TPR) repeat protein